MYRFSSHRALRSPFDNALKPLRYVSKHILFYGRDQARYLTAPTCNIYRFSRIWLKGILTSPPHLTPDSVLGADPFLLTSQNKGRRPVLLASWLGGQAAVTEFCTQQLQLIVSVLYQKPKPPKLGGGGGGLVLACKAYSSMLLSHTVIWYRHRAIKA